MKKHIKKSKKRKVYFDDGRSFADMNVEGMPHYDKQQRKKALEDNEPFTKKEKKRLIIEAYKAYLPVCLICILGFTMTYLFIKYIWLS